MLFLVLDQAFWGLPMPFVALFIWATSRAILALTGYEVPLWLVTPWDTLCCMYLRGHGVRILDADTGASTGAADGLAIPGITSFRGVLLMNHRSWGDFVVDPYQGHCAVVARFAAVAVTCFAGVLGRLCSRVIMIERGKTSRAQLLDMCRSHDRYLIFPEGTRRAGTPGSDLPVALAGVGGLKNIWESRRDALVVITANKERIVNERNGRASYNTTLYRARAAAPVRPSEHATFEEFHAALEATWRETWARAYALRDECERGGRVAPYLAAGGRNSAASRLGKTPASKEMM